MSVLAFFFRTLWLSINVFLRMVPMLVVALFAIYLLLYVLGQEPLALVIVILVVYVPCLIFLFTLAVRAGLAAQNATRGPLFKKLFQATFRIMRFHFMLNNVVMAAIGVGGAAGIIYAYAPDLWVLLEKGITWADVLNFPEFVETFRNIPIAVAGPPALALAIASGLVGASVGAQAATAGQSGPVHDSIWGITRQFPHIFLVSVVVIGIPFVAAIVAFGGPFASIWNILSLDLMQVGLWAIYALWAVSAVAAAQALGYTKTLRDNETRKIMEEVEMMGVVYEKEDIRALRMARQEAATITD